MWTIKYVCTYIICIKLCMYVECSYVEKIIQLVSVSGWTLMQSRCADTLFLCCGLCVYIIMFLCFDFVQGIFVGGGQLSRRDTLKIYRSLLSSGYVVLCMCTCAYAFHVWERRRDLLSSAGTTWLCCISVLFVVWCGIYSSLVLSVSNCVF